MIKRIVLSLKARIGSKAVKLDYKLRGIAFIGKKPELQLGKQPILLGPDEWTVHDETWHHIVNRWENRALVAAGKAPVSGDVRTANTRGCNGEVFIEKNGEIKVDCKVSSMDEWVYLLADEDRFQTSHCALRLNAVFQTIFKEFQIDFHHQDFYNRYRYRFQNDYVYFDIVHNGKFYVGLSKHKFKLVENTEYLIEILVLGNIFALNVNGVQISWDYDPWGYLQKGTVAIILWEDNGRTDMKMRIGPVSIEEEAARC